MVHQGAFGMLISGVKVFESLCPADQRVAALEIVLFFELPLLSTHWALLLDLLGVQPFEDTVHVETV